MFSHDFRAVVRGSNNPFLYLFGVKNSFFIYIFGVVSAMPLHSMIVGLLMFVVSAWICSMIVIVMFVVNAWSCSMIVVVMFVVISWSYWCRGELLECRWEVLDE